MLSVSSLSAYEYCKRKLFLQNVLGIYEPPKAPLVKGQIRHQTYDKINKVEESLVKDIRTRVVEQLIISISPFPLSIYAQVTRLEFVLEDYPYFGR